MKMLKIIPCNLQDTKCIMQIKDFSLSECQFDEIFMQIFLPKVDYFK